MMRIMPAAALALFAANTIAAESSSAAAECTGTVVNLKGVVTSTPASPSDPAALAGCYNAAVLGGLPVADPPLDPPVCLRIDVSGTVKASGYSMLTRVPVFSADGPATTPFCFYLPPSGPGDATRGCGVDVGGATVPFPPSSAGLQGFTSQAALTGSVLGKKYEGTVYTKDTGYITADGFVGQVLLLVGGTGSFVGATGRVAVAGQEVGGFADYTGHICVASKR